MVILGVTGLFLSYLRDTRKFLLAYAWLKNYRSILKCAVCAFQTTSTLAEHACMPRGAAAAEVTRARRGRPAGRSDDLGHHFPPTPPEVDRDGTC